MKQTRQQTFAARIALLLIAALLLPASFALAEENAVVFSNAISVEEIATLLSEEETEAPPEEADRDVRVSVSWLPSDEGAPDSLTVILAGAGAPQMAVLDRSGGWQTTVRLAEGSAPEAYTLVGYDQFTVTKGEDGIAFVVTLPETELPPEEPALNPDRSVTITASIGSGAAAALGDNLTLTGVLNGYEGLAYTLQWQRDTGAGWSDLAGETGLSYTFTLDEHNINWGYRLVVTVDTVQTPPSPEGQGTPETPEEIPAASESGETGQ